MLVDITYTDAELSSDELSVGELLYVSDTSRNRTEATVPVALTFQHRKDNRSSITGAYIKLCVALE